MTDRTLELRTDNWIGGDLKETVTLNPTIDDVNRALQALDQRQHTELAIIDNTWWIAHVGGGNGSYVVDIANQQTGETYQLSTSTTVGDIELVAGGQRGVFSRSDVVDLASAEKALARFVQDGVPDPLLQWRRYVAD